MIIISFNLIMTFKMTVAKYTQNNTLKAVATEVRNDTLSQHKHLKK